MRTGVLCACVMLVATTVAPLGTAASNDDRLARLYEVADSTEYSGNQRITAIVDAYETLFARERSRGDWNGVGDEVLLAFFDAVKEAGFHSGDPGHALEMAHAFNALESRGLATSGHVQALHGLYLHARLLEAARELAREQPGVELEAVPTVIAGGTRSAAAPVLWEIGERAASLVERPVNLSATDRIVVVAHPGCGYTRAAVDAIYRDPVLGPRFARDAIWVAPPAGRLDLAMIRDWNAAHADAVLSLAVRRADWPMIESWATPTFHFFRDGELVETVTGWPLDGRGRRNEVLAALGLSNPRD